MKKKPDDTPMTLRQFLLFMVVCGALLIWLCLEINMRLHPSIDPAVPTQAPSVSQPAEETTS